MTIVLLSVLINSQAWAQTTRADLSEIRVDKEGNFKYWETSSQVLTQLKDYVNDVCDESSANYVPERDRLAVFDLDGTLLCETAPYYLHWITMLEDESYTPTASQRQFAEQAYEHVYYGTKITKEFDDTLQIVQNSAFIGLTQKEMEDYVTQNLLTRPVEGLSNLTWGTALYWPMIEVMSYLVSNDFQVFICSGSDRDIVRPLVRDVLPIPGFNIMSSEVHYLPENMAEQFNWVEPAVMEKYSFDQVKGQRVVRGHFKEKCTAYNKVDFMTRNLGQKPILAFGNSSGDYPMFEYVTSNNPYPAMAFCLLCDDTERELGNIAKAEKCKTVCEENGWSVISMRDDWTTIYGNDVVRITTDVRSANTSKANTSDNRVYDLNGMEKDSLNGLYIINNKKMISK